MAIALARWCGWCGVGAHLLAKSLWFYGRTWRLLWITFDSATEIESRFAKYSKMCCRTAHSVWFSFPLLAENVHMKAIFIDGEETARFRSRSTVRNNVMLAFNFSLSLSVYLFTHRGRNDLSRKSRLFPLNCFDFELATIIIVRQFDNVSRSICTLNSLRTWFRQTIPFSPLLWPERVYMCVCVSTSIFRGNDERYDSMYGKMVCFSPYDNIENHLYT